MLSNLWNINFLNYNNFDLFFTYIIIYNLNYIF